MGDWLAFVSCYRNAPENHGKTMNTCMIEARKLWKDPSIKSEFIRALHGEEEQQKHSDSDDMEEQPVKKVRKAPAKKKKGVKVVSDSSDEEPVKKVKKAPGKKKVVRVESSDSEDEVQQAKAYYKNYYKNRYDKK